MGCEEAKVVLFFFPLGWGGGLWMSSKECLFAFKESSTCVNVLFVPWPIV